MGTAPITERQLINNLPIPVAGRSGSVTAGSCVVAVAPLKIIAVCQGRRPIANIQAELVHFLYIKRYAVVI